MNKNPANSRLGNAIALSSGEFISSIIAFAAVAYLAIVLGPDRFGVLGFAIAIVSFLSVFFDGGFVGVGSRDVARRPSDAVTLASSVTVVRLVIATVCFIVLLSSAWLLESNTEHALVLIATGLLLFTVALDTSWVFKGLESGLPVSASLILRRLVFVILVLLFVAGPEHLLVAPLVQVIGELVGILWLGHRLFARGFGHIDLALGWQTLRSCASLISVKVLRTSITSLDVVLLGLLTTDRAVGLYSAPYRFCFFLTAIAIAIQLAYLPDIGRSAPGEERRDATRRHLEISAAFGIPVAAGGVIVAGPLIQLLFGSEYIEGTHAFQILLCSIGVFFLFAPLHNMLLAQDRLRWEFWGLVVAVATNIVLNLAWIPVYGIVGAAWATLIAEIIILVWCGVTVWSDMGMSLLRPLVAPCVSSAIMVAALLALPDSIMPLLFVTIPVGAAVYIASLVLLRGVPEDAASAFRRLLERHGPI